MSEKAELVRLARNLAVEEGCRRAAGRLFNLAALLLAEGGISNDDLTGQLYAAFVGFDVNEIDDEGQAH